MALKLAFSEGKMDALRSLTYSDTGVRAPYVEKRIPGVDQDASPTSGLNRELTARGDDLKRFSKLLTSPSGLKFQATYALLQQGKVQNKAESLKGSNFKETLKNFGKRVIDTAAGNLGFTATILAQVPVNGTGTHFINPINGPAYLREQGGTGLDNFFRNTLKLPFNPLGFASSKLSSKLLVSNLANPFLQQPDPQFPIEDTLKDKKSLHNYTKSPYELELEKEKLYTESTHVDDHTNPKKPIEVRTVVSKNEGRTKTVELKSSADFTEFSTVKGSVGATTGYQIPDKDGNDTGGILSSPYTIKTRYLTSDSTQQDGILHSPYEEYTVTENLEEATQVIADYEKKDMIPFYFNIYSPDKGRVIFFRSFLDSWSDTYSGEWSNTKYIGRAEPFFTYNGFNRNLTFSFKLAAFNKPDLTPMYEKLNFLVGSTAPTYGQNGQFMRGTLVNLRIGDLIYDVDGFVSSVDLSWNNSYQWETDSRDGENLEQVPHVLDVNVSFTPIHDFNVKFDIDQKNKERYIGRREIPREPVRTVDAGIKKSGVAIPKQPIDAPILRGEQKAASTLTPAGLTGLPTEGPTASKLNIQPISPPVSPSIKPPSKPPGKKKITPAPTVPGLTLTQPALTGDLNLDLTGTAISDTTQFTTTGEGLDTIGTEAERVRGIGYIRD